MDIEFWGLLVPLFVFIFVFCFGHIVYLPVCYCYNVMIGEDECTFGRCCACLHVLIVSAMLNGILAPFSPCIVICFCNGCRRGGPLLVAFDGEDDFFPKVCPCCFKGQFACYWPCCGHQDYITVDCPYFCCCSEPAIRPQTETPVVITQPRSTADITTVTTQSDPQPRSNTDVLSQAAGGGSTTVIIEEGEEDVRPVAVYGEKVRWAFYR